jgi:hypothetical protein
MCFVWFSNFTAIISLNSVKQLVFLIVKSGVLFAVRTQLLRGTTDLTGYLDKTRCQRVDMLLLLQLPYYHD